MSNMNLVFQEKLFKHLRDNLDKSFLNLGSCFLNHVHTTFRRGIVGGSRGSLTSWGEGASLALVGHPSSDRVTIKMPYGVDVLH